MNGSGVVCAPATAERWDDLEVVMDGCSYARKCWCAYWYLPNAAYKAGWGAANMTTLHQRVADGEEPGVIAWLDGVPAGWCAVAPREKHDRLVRSRPFSPLDDTPVWSVTCFVVRKGYRKRGLMRALLQGAIDHARTRGATMLEAYPMDPGEKTGAAELFVGTAAAFRDAGFEEVARPLARRPVMRLRLASRAGSSGAAGTAAPG